MASRWRVAAGVCAVLTALVGVSAGIANGGRGPVSAREWRGGGGAASEAEIRGVLETQTAAWNRGEIETFMTGYWKSDETEFISANGVTRGWQAVLDRYRRGYPDRKAMGHLTFANLEVHVACADAAFAIGEYHLARENDKLAGVFTLNFRRFDEGWKIVADHTTAFAAATAVKSN